MDCIVYDIGVNKYKRYEPPQASVQSAPITTGSDLCEVIP